MQVLKDTSMDIYDRLGVEKLINAAGNNTNIGGSLMAPEVFEAMMEAGRSFVDLVELSQKVGLEIARLARVEAAHVSSGAASGVVLATAACLTGHSRRPSPSGAAGLCPVGHGGPGTQLGGDTPPTPQRHPAHRCPRPGSRDHRESAHLAARRGAACGGTAAGPLNPPIGSGGCRLGVGGFGWFV